MSKNNDTNEYLEKLAAESNKRKQILDEKRKRPVAHKDEYLEELAANARDQEQKLPRKR